MRFYFYHTIIFIIFINMVYPSSPPGWSVNPPDFEMNANVTGVLFLNNSPGDSGNIVGAFYQEECRGLANESIYHEGYWLYFLTIYSNEEGEEIDFKVWLVEQDTILTIEETLEFELNGEHGSPGNPFEWHAGLNLSIQADKPENFQLFGNYPNPFNQSTEITFFLPELSHASLNIFDLSGRNVSTLIEKTLDKGYHSATWSGSDKNNILLSSGIYICMLNARGLMRTSKFILLK